MSRTGAISRSMRGSEPDSATMTPIMNAPSASL
jgi:hypothetical protein